MSERLPRSRAEWTTFGVSLAIVFALIAVLLFESRANQPASPQVRLVRVEQIEGGLVKALVAVRNDGDRAATNVEVIVSASSSGDEHPTQQGAQLIMFLAGHESVEIQFNFSTGNKGAPIQVDDIALRIASFIAS